MSLAVWKCSRDVTLSLTIRQYIALVIGRLATSAICVALLIGTILPYGAVGSGAGGVRVKSPRSKIECVINPCHFMCHVTHTIQIQNHITHTVFISRPTFPKNILSIFEKINISKNLIILADQ